MSGPDNWIELLNHLRVTYKDMYFISAWSSILLDVIRSPEGTQCLFDWCWEPLGKFAVRDSWWWGFGDLDSLKIARSLVEAEEWGKLECWIGIVWMFSESAGITEEDLEHPTLLLLCHRPGAAQKLEQWMEQWSQEDSQWHTSESSQSRITRTHGALERVLTRAQDAAQ